MTEQEKVYRPHRPPEDVLNAKEWFALPNEYIDKIMGEMQEPTDFLVLLLIKRWTYGFNQKQKRISQGFIVKKTGLSRNTVKACLERLQNGGHIIKTDGTDHRKACEWAMNQALELKVGQPLTDLNQSVNHCQGVGQPLTHCGSTIDSQRVNHCPSINKNTVKDKEEKDTSTTAINAADSQAHFNLSLLSDMGISEPARSELAKIEGVDAEFLGPWQDWLESDSARRFQNPIGFVISQIRQGIEGPGGGERSRRESYERVAAYYREAIADA